jgi:hypothetical protein
MKRYRGTEVVRGGYYWSLSRWEIVPVRAEKGALPGEPSEGYWSLPLPLIPIVVALMAVLLAFFVPAIGFVMVGWAGWAKYLKKKVEATATAAAPPQVAEDGKPGGGERG